MNLYTRYYRKILKGHRGKPRGLDVSYITNATFGFVPGTTIHRNGDNPAIGFMEGLQFVAGYFDILQIQKVAPHAKLELFTGQSAYGPRTTGQFEKVIRELELDPFSRRAVVMIAHHDDELDSRPCTLSMQFQIVEGELLTTVNMRSSDAIWGLPYDMIQWGMVTMAVQKCLKLLSSYIVVNMANSHVYDATMVKPGAFLNFYEFDPMWFDDWQTNRIHAKAIAETVECRNDLYSAMSFDRSSWVGGNANGSYPGI